MPKIAFLVHMIAPYRLSFYTKLFNAKEFQWKLFAGYKSNKNDARPQYQGKVDFLVSYHKEITKDIGLYNRIIYDGMLEAVKDYHPDIVIMFAHVGTKSFREVLKWANSNNKKVIMWTCFWEPYYIKGLKKMFRDLYIKSFYKKADHHITYSSIAREKLLNIGYPDSQISIAYNGIDVDHYKEDLDEIVDHSIFDKDSLKFLYCGGLGNDKKPDLFIKAIYLSQKQSKNKIKAYIIGDGPMYKTCKNIISNLNLEPSVKLLGRIDKVGKYIQAADCIVLPGTGGLILNEAVLFNKPLIVSAADGTENDLLVNGFNGLKFASGDEKSLAKAIGEISDNLTFFKENASKLTDIVLKRSNVNSMVFVFLKAIKKIL